MTSVADRLGFGPTRAVRRLADGNYRITVTPPVWTGFAASRVTLTLEQYACYALWREGRMLIQEALPDLSDDEREILMSGIGPADWRRFIGGGE